MSDARSPHDDTMELLHAGYQALESLELEAAARHGELVAARGEPAGFELIAEARMRQGRGEEALEAMELAEKSDSSSWGIVNRIGSICSDLGLHARAEQAFVRALAMPGADRSAISANLAVLCWRAGQTDEAIRWCDEVSDPAWRTSVLAVRVGALISAERWLEAVSATEAIVGEIGATEELGTSRDTFARICALRGRALWNGSADSEGAIACARISLALTPTCPEALETLREARGQRSEHARRFHLIMRGLWHGPLEAGGAVPAFLRTFHVVADDEQEAIGLAMDVEPVPLSMKADKVRDDGPAEPGYKGVTSCSGYMFQPA